MPTPHICQRPNEGGSGSDVESPRISVTNIDLLSGREAATGRGGARSSRRRKLLVDALGDLDDLDSGHSDVRAGERRGRTDSGGEAGSTAVAKEGVGLTGNGTRETRALQH